MTVLYLDSFERVGQFCTARTAFEDRHSKAEYPANRQVDDLEQHPASQPSLPPGRR